MSGSFRAGYLRFVGITTWIGFAAFELACVGFFFGSLADRIFRLGRGYRWLDVWGSIGMAIAAAAIFAFCLFILSVVQWVYRPRPS